MGCPGKRTSRVFALPAHESHTMAGTCSSGTTDERRGSLTPLPRYSSLPRSDSADGDGPAGVIGAAMARMRKTEKRPEQDRHNGATGAYGLRASLGGIATYTLTH